VVITIKLMEDIDIPDLAAAFLPTVWKTPAAYFEKIWAEQQEARRIVLVARFDENIAGYLNVIWQSKYPPFAEQGIPEINDLRVLEQYRRKHIATVLLDEAEKLVFKRFPAVGLGVGLYADYGPAQRLYTRRGYALDGRGLLYKEQPVPPGTNAFVDDDLLLYLVKPSPPRHILPNQ
jgi:GNAT superfamily N-acetyltransferase